MSAAHEVIQQVIDGLIADRESLTRQITVLKKTLIELKGEEEPKSDGMRIDGPRFKLLTGPHTNRYIRSTKDLQRRYILVLARRLGRAGC